MITTTTVGAYPKPPYVPISDWFSKTRRATALAVYIAGNYIGTGLSLLLGGLLVTWWKQRFPVAPPFGLQGWQVTFWR